MTDIDPTDEMEETEEVTHVGRIQRRGIGTVIREAILAGHTNDEALKLAKAEFPNSNTSTATVSWYRNQLRKAGHEVPTARELKRKARAEEIANMDPDAVDEVIEKIKKTKKSKKKPLVEPEETYEEADPLD